MPGQGIPEVVDEEGIEYAHPPDIEPLLSAIEDSTRGEPRDPQFLELFDALDECRGKGRRGLDLYRGEFAFFSDEQIDLVAVRVAEEIELRPDPLVVSALHYVRNDEVFVQIAAQGIDRKSTRLNSSHT